MDLAALIFEQQVSYRVLFKPFEPEALNESRHAGLPWPKPGGSEVKATCCGRRAVNPTAEPVTGFDQMERAARFAQRLCQR